VVDFTATSSGGLMQSPLLAVSLGTAGMGLPGFLTALVLRRR